MRQVNLTDEEYQLLLEVKHKLMVEKYRRVLIYWAANPLRGKHGR